MAFVNGTETVPIQNAAEQAKFVSRKDNRLAIDPSPLYLIGDGPKGSCVVRKALVDQFKQSTWANKSWS